ncbi:MAG: Hsp20 family protein [Bryobacteraceae bacterium]
MTPRISITRINDQEEASSILLAQTEQHLQDIRNRAYDNFQQRGQLVGNDWDDWLRAEREVLWKPHAELFENALAIVLRAAVPGFDPKSVQVTATPLSLLIQGTETHHHQGLEARLHFCEFGQRLFRQFDLPARIDPNTVSATLDKGILEIVASKARPRKAQDTAAASFSDQGETSEPCLAAN